jgi:hypothetical protein
MSYADDRFYRQKHIEQLVNISNALLAISQNLERIESKLEEVRQEVAKPVVKE